MAAWKRWRAHPADVREAIFLEARPRAREENKRTNKANTIGKKAGKNICSFIEWQLTKAEAEVDEEGEGSEDGGKDKFEEV